MWICIGFCSTFSKSGSGYALVFAPLFLKVEVEVDKTFTLVFAPLFLKVDVDKPVNKFVF